MPISKEMIAVGAIGRTTAYDDHKDDFPTPPWAARAFLKYVIPDVCFKGARVLEPASGRGHLADVLEEAGAHVLRYDLLSFRGKCRVADYADPKARYPRSIDYTITNPPYACADDFVLRGQQQARLGTGMLIQTLWMQGKRRWERVMGVCPPTRVGFFCKCIPATRGKVVQKCPAFMSHSWFWWGAGETETQLILIPPFAQKELERKEDYR